MAFLEIKDLRVEVAGHEILRGISLDLEAGKVHAIMGPNGSGKSTLSHVLMGRPGYEVTEGSVTLDGVDLLGLPTWERARAGLFLALQHPTEVPGVSLESVVPESARAAPPAGLLSRPLCANLEGPPFSRRQAPAAGSKDPETAAGSLLPAAASNCRQLPVSCG